MQALNSSLRERTAAETLRLARDLGRAMGIVRVTDTTRLDRLGVPVYASIRPAAMPLSFCVSAGKGIEPVEAEVGAWMEAIELAHVEPGRVPLETRTCTDSEIRESTGYTLTDFCPRADVDVAAWPPVPCVVATNLDTGAPALVPAACVLFPFVDGGPFSSTTNGLASGNTVLEATVHGLSEVIERDIHAIQRVWDTSQLVRNETLPGPLAAIAARTAGSGIRLFVRAVVGETRVPYFHAVIHESNVREGLHEGFGCHPFASIAATRAICEAFQSRLSLIHGGRDDFVAQKEALGTRTAEARDASLDRAAEFYGRETKVMDFAATGDRSGEVTSIEDVYTILRDGLRALDVGPPFRITFTPPDSPLSVVKIVVPRLENWGTRVESRMGPRLRALLKR